MTQYNFSGRTVVVTGAARGIGHACIGRFLADGARCVLWDIDAKALSAAVAELKPHGPVAGMVVNVTRPAAVERAVRRIEKQFGGVDVLVNNAGIAGVS